MQGDIDNIVKPVLDALAQHIYIDDAQVERLVYKNSSPAISSYFRRRRRFCRSR